MSRHLHKDEIVFKHDFFDTSKFLTADLAATGLFVCAVAHSHRYENDGLIRAALLPHLGQLSDLGLADGALTGLYVPASHDALARRLVRAGLFHEAPGGFTIHDYSDYQETTLSRQMRRTRDRVRKREAPPPDFQRESVRNPAGNENSSLPASDARASEALGFKALSTISGSDHRDGADDSGKVLETADYGDHLEWLRRISVGLLGADAKTPLVLGSVMRGLPESVMRDALERLDRRRRNTKRSPVLNEAKYLVRTLQEMRAERAGRAA